MIAEDAEHEPTSNEMSSIDDLTASRSRIPDEHEEENVDENKTEDGEELAPPKPVLSKSISHDVASRKSKNRTGPRSLNKRVQGLRNWIGTYKRWKSWQDRSPEINQKISPLEAIVQLIKQHLDAQYLITAARSKQLRGLHRQMGLKYLTRLLKESKFEVARVNLVGILSESLRNSGRAFKKKLVPVSRCINLYDGLGCCDIRIKKSVQKRLSEFTQISLTLINDKSTSMLTKIIALSDVYGMTFDVDQAELINDQKLIANIFKLIKKTQMILPARSSPRRRSLANLVSMKSRRSKSLK